jgi:hypothetical protein
VLAVRPLLAVGDVLLLLLLIAVDGGVVKLRLELEGPGRGLPLDVDIDDDVLLKALSTTLFRTNSVAESVAADK